MIENIKKKGWAVLHSFYFSIKLSFLSSKKIFIIRLVLEIGRSLLPIFTLYIGKEIINILVSLTQSKQPDVYKFFFFVGVSLVLTITGIVIRKLVEILTGIHKDIMDNFINEEIMKKTASLDISFFDTPRFYDVLLNARRDSFALQTLVWYVISIFSAMIKLLAACLILGHLGWYFPVILVVLNIPAVITERKFAAHLYHWTYDHAPDERKMNYMQYVLTDRAYAKDIRLFSLFEHFFKRYHTIWKQWFTGKTKIIKKRGLWATFTSILPQCGIVFIIIYVGLRIISKKLTLGDFGLYTGIAAQLTSSIYQLIMDLANLYDNQMRIVNYKKFLTCKSQVISSGTMKPPTNPLITFQNVWFRYPLSNSFVLKDLTFHINPGEKIALVGLNGAGKSTIIKLLLRFYEPTKGKILFDNMNVQHYDLETLRTLFGVVFQDYANYAFTLRECIALSSIGYIHNEKRILNACKAGSIDHLIADWQYGLDTFLTKQFSEDGKELSGGEWQKIAVTRAFFRNAQIMILDEPTSNLDPEAEHRIYSQFMELCKDKGAIIISHRLSSTTVVDRILVLENGQIIEEGSHEDLLRLNGRYSYLFQLQAEKYQKHQNSLNRIIKKTGCRH